MHIAWFLAIPHRNYAVLGMLNIFLFIFLDAMFQEYIITSQFILYRGALHQVAQLMGISACLRFDTFDPGAKKAEQIIYVRDEVSLHEI